MQGFFTLQSAHDLFGKLQRDYKRLDNNRLDVDAAFDFFVTAYHLLEWQWPGEKNRTKRSNIEKEQLLIRILSHIANGSKHFEATNPRHNTVAESRLVPGPFSPIGLDARAFDVGELKLTLQGDAESDANYGKQLSVTALAAKVMAHWNGEFDHV